MSEKSPACPSCRPGGRLSKNYILENHLFENNQVLLNTQTNSSLNFKIPWPGPEHSREEAGKGKAGQSTVERYSLIKPKKYLNLGLKASLRRYSRF